jgi:hypothetical protein
MPAQTPPTIGDLYQAITKYQAVHRRYLRWQRTRRALAALAFLAFCLGAWGLLAWVIMIAAQAPGLGGAQ